MFISFLLKYFHKRFTNKLGKKGHVKHAKIVDDVAGEILN